MLHSDELLEYGYSELNGLTGIAALLSYPLDVEDALEQEAVTAANEEKLESDN